MKYIPLSLVSVLEFRHQSLTLKYIEIGLLWWQRRENLGTRLTENFPFIFNDVPAA